MFAKFIENELKTNRKSGTYLFHGDNSEKSFEYAKMFAKAICCKESDLSYCDECSTCLRISRETFVDLTVVDVLKIEEIRKLEHFAMTSSNEDSKKIFILKDIQNMRIESSNAILKLIEEPRDSIFFIMLSTTLNILPTIKSRSILLNLKKDTPEELGVDLFAYNFFYGNSKDILEYKESEIDLYEAKDYKKIYTFLEKYREEPLIENKINIYKSLRDFVKNIDYIDDFEKIFFADEILRGTSSREELKEIISYLILLIRNNKNLEYFLELKNISKYPINQRLLLINFVLALKK